MRRHLLLSAAFAALAGAACTGPAWAEDPQTVVQLDPVTVLATRSERRVDETPATVSVITDAQIEAMLATDIKDLIRFEPGVSVPTSPARFTLAGTGAGRDGASGFTIRGMGGDRVLIVSDGVRLPQGFSFGAQAVGRGGYNELDLVKSVEILRGPASALYGSDGVAGAVAFTTKDPADFLDEGRNFGARARAAYSSADEGWTEGLALAGRGGSLSGLLAYTRRDSRETENRGEVGGTGSARTQPNPQDLGSNAVLAKLVWEASPNHTVRLTYDHLDSEMDGEALSSLSPTVLAVTAHDETQRDRVSLDWRFRDFAGLDQGSIAAYWQDSTTEQYTYEDRTPAVDRERNVTFDNTVKGVAAQGQKSFGGDAVRHRVTFGGDWSLTTQEGVRDGVTPPVGESFPARAFPNTDYQLAGLFVQDEIELLGGTLSIIPALRYDWYDLDPQPDALFPAATEGQTGDHVSPKLGVVYWPHPRFGVFANYAEGFRAPSPMQVNNYFANPVYGYESIPNPDLAPETSDSIEAGVRFRDIEALGGVMRFQATAFSTGYDNFIEQVVVSGTGVPGVDPLIFQYVNLTEVGIRGLEARGDIDWGNGFGVIVSAAYAEGDQRTDGERTELPSVDPVKLVAGLNYAAPSGAWGGSAVVTWSGRKAQATYNLPCADACSLGDSFTLLDLTAYWNVTDHAVLRAGVFNVFDETYAWWSDVQGQAAASTIKDAFTQPGRNFGVSLSFRL